MLMRASTDPLVGPYWAQGAHARDLLDRLDLEYPVDACRRDMALELIDDMERLDDQLKVSIRRVSHAVNSSNTTLTEIMGCGPITAALILSRVRNVDRFPNRDHFAAYNGTARSKRHRGSAAGTG